VLRGGGDESKTWKKEAKQYINKTSIKRVVSFLPLEVGGLVEASRGQWRFGRGNVVLIAIA